MSIRAVTFGARARTAPRHLLDEAVPASRSGRAERASAMSHPQTHAGVLSSWPGVTRTENPRSSYAVGVRSEPAALVRGSSRRIMSMWFRPTDIRLIIVDASPGPLLNTPTIDHKGRF